MEEIGSEVYLWLTDKWIDFSLIEDLDIDTTMTTYDLGELRMIWPRYSLVETTDDTRKYLRSTEIPTAHDDEVLMFWERYDIMFIVFRDSIEIMESSHIIPTDLKQDIVVFFLFRECYLRSDSGDHSSRYSLILDTSGSDIFRKLSSDALFRMIRSDSDSRTISEDEQWYSSRTSW